MASMNDNGIIDFYNNKAEDERTVMPKNDTANVRRVTIDAAHSASGRTAPSLLQRAKNAGYAFSMAERRIVNSFKRDHKQVRFAWKSTVATYHSDQAATWRTYNLGSDGHYLCDADSKKWASLSSASFPSKSA